MAVDSHTHDGYSHDKYFDAFQQFMQTGEKEQLSLYLEGSRSASFLSVYRNGFIRASTSALESNFPSLVKLWGEDYFSQVASAYVSVQPPSSATLIGYGFKASANTTVDAPVDAEVDATAPSTLSFVEFLQKNFSEVIAEYPYVPDICQLDQAWLEALNENGESFLTLSVVQEMIAQGKDLGELSLSLVDSSRVVDLEFELFELWGQLRFGELSEDQNIELTKYDNSVIFWQRELQVQAKPLSEIEAVFMQSLKQTSDFGTATNKATAADENFDVSTIFAELLNAHLLTA